VVVSLYSAEVVREVLGSMLPRADAGRVIVDTTTASPEMATTIGTGMREAGHRYVEAPLSGSSDQTRRGEAVALVGGTPDDVRSCADLWPVLAGSMFHVGPIGAAARMKLVSNLVLGLNRAALAEGLVFAQLLGVEPAAALEVLRGSMAYSRAIDAKGRKMIERDFAVQAKLSQHLRDVRLMLDAARAAGSELPLAETHRRLLERAEQLGYGEADNSAVIEAMGRGMNGREG
jgi:3-hydroxyisobutyrate dehydrogenase-like beta-hydroxyacid dehydrogenase